MSLLKRIRIYGNSICEIGCEYCNMNTDMKTIISEEDIINYIKNNIYSIDTNSIEVLGGEPLLYHSLNFLSELNNIFNEIVIYSTLPNEIKPEIKKFILENNVSIVLHYRGCFNNTIKELKEKINEVSIVLTNGNIHNLYLIIKDIVNELDVNNIHLNPEITTKKYVYDEDIVIREFDKIWSEKLEFRIKNWWNFFKKRDINPNNCVNEQISILPDGMLSSCEFISPFYGNESSNNVNIHNTKLEDYKINLNNSYSDECLSCKKCFNYKCKSIYHIKDKYPNICQFNKLFYDYSHNKEYEVDYNKFTIFMTEKCNMKCKYCFEGDFKNQFGSISNELIDMTLTTLFKRNPNEHKSLLLFGGEPTLNIDGLEYIYNWILNYKKENQMNFTLEFNTNLLYLNDRLLNILEKIAKEVKLFFSVSIDGCKEAHDKFRRDVNDNPTYEKIIKNVKILRNKLNPYNFCGKRIFFTKHCVLTDETIDYFEEMINESIKEYEENIFDSFSASLVTSGKGEIDKLSLSKIEKYIELKSYFKNKYINSKYYEYLSEALNYFTLDDYIWSLEEKQRDPGLCGIFNTNIALRSNGDIIPCHAFMDMESERKYYNQFKIESFEKKYKINDKLFFLLFKIEFLNKGILKIESEYGYDCTGCPINTICGICLGNCYIDLDNYKIVKRKEECDRYMNFLNIYSKIYEKRFNKKINDIESLIQKEKEEIINGMNLLSTVSNKNSENILEITNIINNIFNSKEGE